MKAVLPILAALLLAGAAARAGLDTNRVHTARDRELARAATTNRPARAIRPVTQPSTNDASTIALGLLGRGWVTTTREGYIWHSYDGGDPVWIKRTREGATIKPLLGPPTRVSTTGDRVTIN